MPSRLRPSLRLALGMAASLAVADAAQAAPVPPHLPTPSSIVAAQAVIISPYAPPPPRYEVVPAPPPGRHSFVVWDPGHWNWDGRQWIWIPGHYEERPHPHAVWVVGHWAPRHGQWVWIPPHWQ